MPISDKDYYAYKFVNGHPGNPLENKQTVVAIGTLADVKSGYPVLISEMTVLTALRTAATSALAAKYLVAKNAHTFGIIGTGAQSEFQVLAHHFALGINKIFYYDIDANAMQKFFENLHTFGLELEACRSAEEVVAKSRVLTTATAKKANAKVVHAEWVQAGTHINGIGGDCPGKTELDPELVKNSKIVVEYSLQTEKEGEVQHIDRHKIYAELWELVTGKKPGRESEQEITLFDSVGFALEDYSILRLVYSLAEEYHVGHMLDLIPGAKDPKDLYSLLNYK
jgi:ornithine cyclodeaminase